MADNPVQAWAQRHQRTKDQEWREWQSWQLDQAYRLSELGRQRVLAGPSEPAAA